MPRRDAEGDEKNCTLPILSTALLDFMRDARSISYSKFDVKR
jgi:hypothetical protein